MIYSFKFKAGICFVSKHIFFIPKAALGRTSVAKQVLHNTVGQGERNAVRKHIGVGEPRERTWLIPLEIWL